MRLMCIMVYLKSLAWTNARRTPQLPQHKHIRINAFVFGDAEENGASSAGARIQAAGLTPELLPAAAQRFI
jgi:hypothetical protein